MKVKVKLETSPSQWNKICKIRDILAREAHQELKMKKSTFRLDQHQKGIQAQKRENTSAGSRGTNPTSST